MNKLYLNFRKQLIFIVLLLPFLGLGQTAMAGGDYIISSSNNNEFPNFRTITSAIKHLNSNGISGNVCFLLNDKTYNLSTGESFPITIRQFKGSESFTVTIKPNTGKTVTVEASTPSYNNPLAVFKLDGADNVIFDGSYIVNGNTRDLTFYNTNPNSNNGVSRAVIWIASNNADGANNNIIKNVIIKQASQSASAAISIGVFAGGTTSVNSFATAANSSTIIENVLFDSVGNAIYVLGSADSNFLSADWKIQKNIIGGTTSGLKPDGGIYLSNIKNYEISGNVITGIKNTINASNIYAAGIALLGSSSGTISKNKISDVTNIHYGSGGSATAGVYVQSTGDNSIVNNFISNIYTSEKGNNNYNYNYKGHGIYVKSGGTTNLYFNTVLMNYSDAGGLSSCLYLEGGTSFAIRNNIFNNVQPGIQYGIFANVDKSTIRNISNNSYFVSRATPTIDGSDKFSNRIGTTVYTGIEPNGFTKWKTDLGNQDLGSIIFSPTFVSSTDLHLANNKYNIDALKAGTPIAGILTDIDGEKRNLTKPFMGADELLCVLATPVAQITQPTCDLPTGSIALAELPSGPWFINYGERIISGQGSTTLLRDLQPGVYKITVSTDDGCRSAPLTVVLDPITNIWEGNWSANKPPTINQHIIFNDDFVSKTDIEGCSCTVVNGDVTFKSQEGGANLGFNLTVAKAVTVKEGGSLTFETNANLIQLDEHAVNSGKITVERLVKDMDNVLTGPGAQMDYVYWSSPVAGQKTKGPDGFSPGTPSNRFYTYNESNDYFYETADLTFVPGRGYAVRAEVSSAFPANPKGYDKIYKFHGIPHNGTQEVVVKRSPNSGVGGAVIHGYNLIGNPYPSNINFKQLYTQNLRLIHNTAWFWTNNSFVYSQQAQGYQQNNYAVFNGVGGAAAASTQNTLGETGNTNKPNEFIAVGQGFIVQVRNLDSEVTGPQTVKFEHENRGEKLRVSTPGVFFNRQDGQVDRYWLNLLSPNLTVNNQLIGYIDGATNDFEQDFDAELLSFGSDVFYSVLGDRNLQIQGKAAFTQEDKVILGANFFSTGTYTIVLDEAEGLFKSSQPIYLKDKQTGKLTNLSQDSYTFEATKGVSAGRFEIVYKPETVLGTGDIQTEEIQVYRDAGNFVVRSRTKKITDLEVYDTSGRLVYKIKPNAATAVISGENLTQGIYVLKIDQNGTVTGKKILK